MSAQNNPGHNGTQPVSKLVCLGCDYIFYLLRLFFGIIEEDVN